MTLFAAAGAEDPNGHQAGDDSSHDACPHGYLLAIHGDGPTHEDAPYVDQGDDDK